MISNSRSKLHQTTYKDFFSPLYLQWLWLGSKGSVNLKHAHGWLNTAKERGHGSVVSALTLHIILSFIRLHKSHLLAASQSIQESYETSY